MQVIKLFRNLNFNRVFFCGILFWSGNSFSVETSKSLTLRDVFALAKDKTENVRQAQSAIRETEALKDQVYGRFLPTLSLSANYLRQSQATVSNSENQTATRFILSQSLYSGGKDWASYQASKAELSARQHNLVATENNLFVDVARSFFSVLAAEQDIKNLQKTIELTDDRVKELRRRRKLGKTQNVEVLAAEAQLAVLNSQLVAAYGTLNVERDTFSRASGLDRATPLTDPMRFPREPQTVEAYLPHIENRPDILALKFAAEATEREVRAAEADHYPTLSLTANSYLSQSGVQTNNSRDWDLGVTLSFPLFSGGIVAAKVREVRETDIQANLLLNARRRIAEEEVRRSFSKLSSALEQVKSLEGAVTATEQNYREQVRNYQFSQSTNLDVIQALASLRDTRRTLDKMRFEALTAWAELKTASAQVWK